jgi:serine/threonine protein kinase/Tfp pilus assembly protein PilF
MGEVYRAKDTRLDRTVAIKVIAASLGDRPDLRQRFEREARAVSCLSHPHICALFDVGEATLAGVGADVARPVAFLVMEFLDGETLAARLRKGPLPIDQVLRYAIEIAAALDAAHRHGIVHRDLKPGNIMVTKTGAKLLDFGLAKAASTRVGPRVSAVGAELAPPTAMVPTQQGPLTSEGTILGTFNYMAPEQLHGREADARSDLFAFGAVVYEMATGRKAFDGVTPASVIAAILEREPESLSQLQPLVPPAFDHLVSRCLQKDPDERWQDARDLLAQLEWLKEGRLLSARAPATGSLRSIAVLPLANLSSDPDQAFFADGMTEALITNLARIGSLNVISRTTIMRYKGTVTPIPTIARELGVDAIVEGSVLRAGDQVRITAQLIHAASDTHLWAESYDRPLQNVLTLQSEVARAIAHEVRAKLTPQEEAKFGEQPAVIPAAYEAWLKGRHFWNRRGGGVAKSIEFFEAALRHDPNYAPAYAGLAEALALLAFYGHVAAHDGMPRARHAAQRALTLDPTLTEAHACLGYVHTVFDWEWEPARRCFETALQLNPQSPEARYWYSCWLWAMDRMDAAIAEPRAGLVHDPLNVYMHTQLATVLLASGRYADAAASQALALELEPQFGTARAILGMCRFLQGLPDEAVRECDRAIDDSERHPWAIAWRAWIGASLGDHDAARQLVQELEARANREYVQPNHIATVYAGLGEGDRAFEWLRRAFDERVPQVVFYRRRGSPAHLFAGIRSDARYAALVERLGLGQPL